VKGAKSVLSVSYRKAAVGDNPGGWAVKIGHKSPLPVGVLEASISREDEQSRVRFGDD
jgi:hypothetical protein